MRRPTDHAPSPAAEHFPADDSTGHVAARSPTVRSGRRGGGRRHLIALAAILAGIPGSGCGPNGGAPEPAQTPAPPVFPAQNRPDVRGTSGALSSDHPLATAAGHDVLRRGGNAVDAAIAMAGVLAVVRPHMNGVGGDAFGLFYEAETGAVTALNGSGRAGALAEPAFFGEGESARIPSRGAGSVSVPGAVAAWVDAHERYGTLPFAELLAPAIAYARDGFPVSWRLASDISSGRNGLNDAARRVFLPGGDPPEPGTLQSNPALARTLEAIASGGKEAFYRGDLARSIAGFVEAEGGYLRAGDLAAHESTWVEPLSVDYLDHRFLAFPPNTQGITQLQLFEMAKSFDLQAMDQNSSSYLHTLIELKKLAFADRDAWIGDAGYGTPVDRLLDSDYLAGRARLVDPTRASAGFESGIERDAGGAGGTGGAFALSRTRFSPSADDVPDDGDTVYLTVVDQWGNAVSWIQSLFNTFGSGLMDPTTGVVLQNRGALFTLEEGHPNLVAPGKRPFHTLTPLIALRDGALAFTLGTPGGDAQTQSLLQVTNNLLLFGLSPQQALEAPRFRSQGGVEVAIEDRIDPSVRDALAALGHELVLVHDWTATFGGAQMILVDRSRGTLVVASDPRREAYAIAY